VSTSRSGLGLAALSAATFGTSGTFATGLMAAGWTPGAAVTVRVGIAALLLTGPALLQLRGRWALLRRSLSALLAYGVVAVAGCQLFYFNAVEHLSVGIALILEYSGTLLVVLWVWLRDGRQPTLSTIVGGAVALSGLGLVLDLAGDQHVDAIGIVWGLLAAVGGACYFVLSAHREDSLPPMVMAWGGMAIGTVVLLAAGAVGVVSFGASTADADFAGHHTSWIVPVIGLSLLAAVIAYSAGIGAARRLGARMASFIGLTEVLFASLFAWAFLGERPGLAQAVGGVLVLGGIALVRAGEREVVPESPELVPA
jgi:drug/metabolite transporter (DMT)-like permease